jgi:isoleucyl-tRNA synthetase
MRDIMNRVFRMLWNSYYFFVMYASIDKFDPKKEKPAVKNLLDKWIISELQILIKNIDGKLEEYDIYSAAKSIEPFIDNLSNWYIRRSRKRFWKSENDADKNEAYATLHYVLVTLAKLMAPFTPFVAEEIFRNLTGFARHPERSPYSDAVEGSTKQSEDSSGLPQNDKITSVHLEDYPVADEKLIDEKINIEMQKVREIVTTGLQKRAEEKIKVRQPLSAASIKYDVSSIELQNVIKEELNIKEIVIDEKQEEDVKLNTEITEELKLEGQAREAIRFIQEMRKEAGYQVDNRIKIGYSPKSEVFEKFGKLIAKETLADEMEEGTMDLPDLEKEFSAEDKKISIAIKK